MATSKSNDDAPNTEVVQGQASEMTPYQKFVTYVLDRAQLEDNDWSAEELTRDQVEAVMNATDEEALFTAMELAGLTGLQYLDNGQEIVVQGFRYVIGNLGIGAYAVIDATDVATGVSLSLDTGVERVMAFLRMCEHLGLFPVHVVVSKKTTQAGNEMVTLHRPVRRPVKSSTE